MINPPHPGEALRHDVLPELGLAASELARLLNYPSKQLEAVLNGCAPICDDLAQRLELAGLGAARVYLAEQAAYDAWLTRNS